MDDFNARFFKVLDSKEITTLAFLINKSIDDKNSDSFLYSLKKLESSAVTIDDGIEKTFYLDSNHKGCSDLVLLTLGPEKAMLNTAVLRDENELLVGETPEFIQYKILHSDVPVEYKNISYSPTFERAITIIDPELADEVMPTIYLDETSNNVKAKVKMLPNRSYIALEIKDI